VAPRKHYIFFVCRNCGHIILAQSPDEPTRYWGVARPEDVARRVGGRCPRCGAPLGGAPAKIDFLQLEAAKKLIDEWRERANS